MQTLDPKSSAYADGMNNFFKRTIASGVAGQVGASLTVVLLTWGVADRGLLLLYLAVHWLLVLLSTLCQISTWKVNRRGRDGIPILAVPTGVVARLWCGSLCWLDITACESFTFVASYGIVLTACAAGTMITQGPLKNLARQTLFSLLLPFSLACFATGYIFLGLAVLYFLYVVGYKGVNQMHSAYCELILRRSESAENAQKLKEKNLELLFVNETLQTEIHQREKSEEERSELQRELIDASRKAGKAELATGVLHNVGNVMNSVNVSVGLIEDDLRETFTAQLNSGVEILKAHEDDLPTFFADDPRGQHIVSFLDQLHAKAVGLSKQVLDLREKVEHVNAVVASQQSHAAAQDVSVEFTPEEVVETAFHMISMPSLGEQVRVLRYFSPTPTLVLDRQRVLQVVVNLIQNAVQALSESETEQPTLMIRSFHIAESNEVQLTFTDNGIGIPKDILPQIFRHGFSTRKDEGGHGFGLHHSACALSEIGGQLTADSAGPGKGATFTIHLPVEKLAAEPAPLPSVSSSVIGEIPAMQ